MASQDEKVYDVDSTLRINENQGSSGSSFVSTAMVVIGGVVVVQLFTIIGLQATKGTGSSDMPSIVINTAEGSVTAPTTETGSGYTMGEMDTKSVFSNVPDNKFFEEETVFSVGENVCAGKKPDLPNIDCIHVEGPQSGANVTKGYKGDFVVDHDPLLTPYWMNSMCPVNVHWHLGSEHYSVGQFDENGDGPNGNVFGPEGKLEGGEQPGYRCHHYDETDPKFTTPYEWKHCKGMLVGETYEVHWPHSAAGACGTVNQYQTPFYDGVFCTDGVLTDVPKQVGVQGQVYTVVNDESYFYPDLIRGWIVDGEYGTDIHHYTGSTTGASRSNEICSQYAPITWQVDRKCHLISASSFDKLCYDMKLQRDDMTDDLHAHGSRELVDSKYVANNGQRRHLHEHEHDHEGHDHDHDHEGHGHHHHEWF